MAKVAWKSFCRTLAQVLPSVGDPQGASESAPQVLAIVPPGPNHALLRSLSQKAGWALRLSETLPTSAPQGTAPVVIYDRDLAPSRWREIVGILSRMPHRPYVILLSPNTDANLWEELQRVGGSDIVRTPADPDRVLGAVRRAWLLWRNQQQVKSARP